jgi:ABC-2 type transport system permease protein
MPAAPARRTAVPAAKPATFATKKPTTDTAPVFGRARTGIREQGYRHWEGAYTGHAFRWWTIAKATLRSTIYTKGRLFLLLVLIGFAWIFPFFLGVFYFFGEIQSRLGRPPDDLLRTNLSELLTSWQWMWAVVFSATVGSRLVSNDLRSEAFYIYLSKPIRRIDYFIGKTLACVLWMIPVTLAPSLWVLAAANGAGNKVVKLSEPTEIFFELLGVQLLLLFLCSSVAVAMSSLTKRWALALIAWMGAAFILIPIAEITSSATRDPEWLYLSPMHNLWNVADHVFEQNVSAQFSPAWEGSLWILIGFIVAALLVFLARVWKLEAAE